VTEWGEGEAGESERGGLPLPHQYAHTLFFAAAHHRLCINIYIYIYIYIERETSSVKNQRRHCPPIYTRTTRACTPYPLSVLKVHPSPRTAAQIRGGGGGGGRNEWSAPGQRNQQCAWPWRPVTIFRRPPPPQSTYTSWSPTGCVAFARACGVPPSPLSRLTIDLPGRWNASLCSRPSARVSLSPWAQR